MITALLGKLGAAKVLGTVAGVALLAMTASPADARTHVSIGIGFGGYCGPTYYPSPVYYRPAPVYYAPAPVVYSPPTVVYSAPVYSSPVYTTPVYAPAPVYYSAPVYYPAPVYYGGYYGYGRPYYGHTSFSFGFRYRR